MVTEQKTQIIQESLRHLAATHAAAVAEIERTMQVLAIAMETEPWLGEYPATAAKTSARRDGPAADRPTLSAVWRGRSCFLGNTLLFRFFERLARTPNHYVTYAALLDDVWEGDVRSKATIRGVAKRLRDRLCAGGMSDLAQAVNGSEAGHYGLILV